VPIDVVEMLKAGTQAVIQVQSTASILQRVVLAANPWYHNSRNTPELAWLDLFDSVQRIAGTKSHKGQAEKLDDGGA